MYLGRKEMGKWKSILDNGLRGGLNSYASISLRPYDTSLLAHIMTPINQASHKV